MTKVKIYKKSAFIKLLTNNIIYKFNTPYIKNLVILHNYLYKHKIWKYNVTKRK